MKGILALGGIVVGGLLTWSRMKGQGAHTKAVVALESVTGYNMDLGNWAASRMTFTIPVVGGAAGSLAAQTKIVKKKSINAMLPAGINL